MNTILSYTWVTEVLAPLHALHFGQDDKSPIIHHCPFIHPSIYSSLQQILLSTTPASHCGGLWG